MKRFFTLLIGLIAIVGTAGATDYSIGADEGGWKIKGQMTANNDGSYSYIINLPSNYDNYLFTIFEGTTLDWNNAYRPNGAVANWGVDGNNTPTMSKGANDRVLIFPVSSTKACALKVDFAPSTGVCTITRLISVITENNSWSTETDYLAETSRASNIYTGGVAVNTSGYKFVVIEGKKLVYYSKKDNTYIDKDQNNESVDADGVYTLTANFSNYNWVAPTRVTANASVGVLGVGTFSSEYALDFTGITDIKAYTITGEENGQLTKAQVTGKVKAGTGLFIENGNGDAASASVNVPTTIYTTDPGTNWMQAGNGEKVYSADGGGNKNYILTTNGGATARFYRANSEGNDVPVGKAYLRVPSDYSARESLWFGDDETTDVKAIDNGQLTIDNKAPMYNLAGQRVSENYKGVVIQKGKKFVK